MGSEDIGKRVQLLTLKDALDCIREIYGRHEALGKEVPSFVVLVGGTALAAHDVRDESEDVDFYAPTFDNDILQDAETRLKSRYGDTFKIDATSGENIWGD